MRLGVALWAVAAALAVAASAAPTASPADHPKRLRPPSLLWKSYPLEQRPNTAATAGSPKQEASRPASVSGGRGWSSDVLLAAVLLSTLLAAGAATFVWARPAAVEPSGFRRRRARSPLTTEQGQRLATLLQKLRSPASGEPIAPAPGEELLATLREKLGSAAGELKSERKPADEPDTILRKPLRLTSPEPEAEPLPDTVAAEAPRMKNAKKPKPDFPTEHRPIQRLWEKLWSSRREPEREPVPREVLFGRLQPYLPPELEPEPESPEAPVPEEPTPPPQPEPVVLEEPSPPEPEPPVAEEPSPPEPEPAAADAPSPPEPEQEPPAAVEPATEESPPERASAPGQGLLQTLGEKIRPSQAGPEPPLEPVVAETPVAPPTPTRPAAEPKPATPEQKPRRRRPRRRARRSGANVQHCEIKLWRGFVKCQFYAVPAGSEEAFAVSPYFRLKEDDAPTEQAEKALAVLLEKLERADWVVASTGATWYRHRLEKID